MIAEIVENSAHCVLQFNSLLLLDIATATTPFKTVKA